MARIITSEIRQSNVFMVRTGHQVTLQAVGLQGTDHVIVEILGLDRGAPRGTFCCPNPTKPSEIISVTPLRCRNGARVILTKEFPTATLSSPQETPLRARVIADVTAVVTVDAEETEGVGCDTCACVEPYCASYPLPGGGYGYINGDFKDPEATVDVNACQGSGPTAWIFPTARFGATAPQYDCAGTLIGYARNASHCAIELSSVIPCAAKVDADHSVTSTTDEAATATATGPAVPIVT